MKNILVPTDFSECANDATLTAIELAKLNKANVHFFHKLKIRKDWNKLSAADQQNQADVLAKINKAEQKLATWTDRLRVEGVKCFVHWSPRNLIKGINKYIQSNAIDFIVIGAHGKSGKNDYRIGSNAQKIIRSIHLPALVLKEPLRKSTFGKVVFASSFNQDDIPSFNYLLDFVQPFKPEIHLVAINKSSFFSQPHFLVNEAMKDFELMASPLYTKRHFFRDFDVEKGIRAFSQQIEADLIVISNHHRHPLKRMLVGSNVEALVNHAQLPVLSIDFLEAKTESKDAEQQTKLEQVEE